ncbi:hypothetical protein HRbin17_02209 [bacterium HR17]|uniref:Uncharacterized protein n=1 Tax=Candidatus Fervidibacter japonicus TaxID=2035412 RepID=A0A2H5XER4_9BACT|nr:hypothetical protein HRbin17_02209 [bacterium HR17]
MRCSFFGGSGEPPSDYSTQHTADKHLLFSGLGSLFTLQPLPAITHTSTLSTLSAATG